MNFYKRHLGDYAKDAGHLSMIEHGAYGLLLDRYYATEAPIPKDDIYRITRASDRSQRSAVDAVLKEFFTLTESVYRNKRADLEIERAAHQRTINQETGKKGGRPPKCNRTVTESVSVDNRTGTESKPNDNPIQTPDSRLQSKSAFRASRTAPPDFKPDTVFALAELPGIDLETEIAKFRDCEFRTPHRDWSKVWRNWVRTCKENGRYAKAAVEGVRWG